GLRHRLSSGEDFPMSGLFMEQTGCSPGPWSDWRSFVRFLIAAERLAPRKVARKAVATRGRRTEAVKGRTEVEDPLTTGPSGRRGGLNLPRREEPTNSAHCAPVMSPWQSFCARRSDDPEAIWGGALPAPIPDHHEPGPSSEHPSPGRSRRGDRR